MRLLVASWHQETLAHHSLTRHWHTPKVPVNLPRRPPTPSPRLTRRVTVSCLATAARSLHPTMQPPRAMFPLCLGLFLLATATAVTVPATNVTAETRACQPPHDKYPFCDTSLPVEQRVKNLISLLADDEKPPLLTAREGGGEPSPTTAPARFAAAYALYPCCPAPPSPQGSTAHPDSPAPALSHPPAPSPHRTRPRWLPWSRWQCLQAGPSGVRLGSELHP